MTNKLPWLIGSALLLVALPVHAEDIFLTIGGGYSPQGNQISLEKNVLMFRDLLQEKYPEGARHDVFFSDGDDPGRDLQFSDPAATPRANQLLAMIFHDEKELGYEYRSHVIERLAGGSNKANLERWFNEVGAKLTQADRLFIYVTAHGGKADKKTPHNTSLYLWNGEKMLMTDFEQMLGKVPSEVPVTLVMVQCYSGGFANLIFDQGDSHKGATQANRAGFFATVQERPAAGCTPDIDEENYREYSSYFWAAVRGKTRGGETIELPDYDHDGRVSFAEAHAYSLLTSTTIDISVKTSDAFLRAFSKQGDDKHPDLLKVSSPYEELASTAGLLDRLVLEGLCEQLQISGDNRWQAVIDLEKQLGEEEKKFDGERKQVSGKFDAGRKEMEKAIKLRWPEFANRWNPLVTQLLTNRADELISFIESQKEYSNLQKLHEELGILSQRSLDFDRKKAKCQRVKRLLENIVLAANLPHVAEPKQVERYQQLLEAENKSLGPAAGIAQK